MMRGYLCQKGHLEIEMIGISSASLLSYLYVSTGYSCSLMEVYNSPTLSGTNRLMTSASEIGLDPAARFGDF
jgi:hypothetical protein